MSAVSQAYEWLRPPQFNILCTSGNFPTCPVFELCAMIHRARTGRHDERQRFLLRCRSGFPACWWAQLWFSRAGTPLNPATSRPQGRNRGSAQELKRSGAGSIEPRRLYWLHNLQGWGLCCLSSRQDLLARRQELLPNCWGIMNWFPVNCFRAFVRPNLYGEMIREYLL